MRNQIMNDQVLPTFPNLPTRHKKPFKYNQMRKEKRSDIMEKLQGSIGIRQWRLKFSKLRRKIHLW